MPTLDQILEAIDGCKLQKCKPECDCKPCEHLNWAAEEVKKLFPVSYWRLPPANGQI